MKFRYKKVPSDVAPTGYSTEPYIQVSLRYENKALNLRGLIDSGAADCLFHRSVGVALGIDIESGVAKTYTRIASQSVVGYVHPVSLQVQGTSEWVPMEAAFIDADLILLLGQSGFFENFQIVFERYRGRFEVNSRARYRVRH
jgi:hypothetical protein